MAVQKIAGFDLGKTSISAAVVTISGDGEPPILDRVVCEPHGGRPLPLFRVPDGAVKGGGGAEGGRVGERGRVRWAA